EDRTTRMWNRIETDSAYRGLAQRIWAQGFGRPALEPAVARNARRDELIARAVTAVSTLRARGVPVLFVRFPSSGGVLENEQKFWPRETTWDVLLAKSGAPGVHFEDEPTLRGYQTPEWSHLTAAEADRFTAALHAVIARRNLPGWSNLVQ
ncbi:MAG TPA: hypothetical protein VE869_18000, partial [Gemmatimonas sp.]|nr:hypothetical protein [Gemmatimonas sp.]